MHSRLGAPCIFIDADSFPSSARDLVIRMAKKRGCRCCFVANRPLPIETRKDISLVRVPAGKDEADRYLRMHASTSDLVLTRDTVLAELLAEQGIHTINHQGLLFDKDNAAERRSLRDYSLQLYQCGALDAWHRKNTYGKKELAALADTLDRVITALMKKQNTAQSEEKPQ